MNEEEIKHIVENFPDYMFFGAISKEDQIERYVSVISSEWVSIGLASHVIDMIS